MKRYTGEACSFEQLSAISKALSERYTGVFFIDLTEDSYISIRALDTVAALIADLPSARAALLSAIESTTHSEFLREMEKFVDLTTLPERMENTDCISKTYRSKISGWVCGSFMEAKRENGRLTQVLYTYQVVEEEQRREEKQTQDSAAIERYQQIQAAVGTVDDVLNNVGLLDNISSEAELRRMLPILLASLGRYAMADRAYLFKWASQDRQVMRMIYEWCADGVEPTMGKMQSVSLSDMPNWMPRLNRGEAILAMDWDAERTKTPEEFATFDGQNIHSLMVIPIFTNKTLNGYVGFDNPAQSRYALSLRLLNAVGGHLGALTENLRMMTELEEKQRSLQNSLAELNREKKILDALSVDYTSVYFCDLDADLMIALKQGELTNSAVAEKALKEGLQSYAFRIRYYYDNFVVQESAPDFLIKMSAEYLKEYLSRNNRLAYRFRTNPNPAGQQYFEVQIVRLTDADGFKAVMGYRYIDDIIAEQEEQKIKLEEALAKATLNSEIVGAISKLYWLIYRMDLVKGTYEEISAGQEMHQLTGKRGSTAEVFREVRETIVCREHQRIMAEFLDTSTLAERLRDTESVEMEYRAVSGSWHLGRFIVKKRDDDGRVTNVLYVVRQIDKQKQQELEYKQKLIATAEEAKRANIAKTDFLRRMSHDIRTPINGIRGIVSIANHYPEDIAKQEDCRNKVMQASGFLLDLVNSVLDMNKLESGVVVLDHKPFDLRDVLEETCSIIEMQAQEYAVPLERKPRHIEHPYLIGSPLHLRQTLQNVASNAVKYSRAGGNILVSCNEIEEKDGKATFLFVCEDNGRGMSEGFLKKAFEPFTQEGQGARTSFTGTGLGLTITRQLVTLMGGEISIESRLGVGTKVSMTIPFDIDTEHDRREVAAEEIDDIPLTGVHVLLVEDNDLNMEIAKFLLEHNGLTVTSAWNGQEAVDLFSRSEDGEFDVILMDVMMPVMDGLDATCAIRAMKRSDARSIPIFAMTANAFPEDIQRSREAGMNEHLTKPLQEADVMRTIRWYIRNRREK